MLLALSVAANVLHFRWNIFSPLFWFMTGEWLLLRIGGLRPWAWLTAYFAICVARFMTADAVVWTCLNLPVILIGIVGIWNLYDVIAGPSFNLARHQWLQTACGFTFFIYLFHVPALIVVRNLLLIPLGRTSLGFAACYVVSPLIFTVLCIFVGILFHRLMPKVYGVCVGGR